MKAVGFLEFSSSSKQKGEEEMRELRRKERLLKEKRLLVMRQFSEFDGIAAKKRKMVSEASAG